MNALLALVGVALRAGLQAWLAVWSATRAGRAEEIARANAEAAEAERRAGAVLDKTVEEIARDLDGGGF